MKTAISAILIAATALTAGAQEPKRPAAEAAKDGVRHVDAAGAKKLIDGGDAKSKVVVIDVRTAEEYKDGHISGSKNIDLMSKDFADKLGSLDKSATFLVHCQAGRRSTKSLETFKKLGFKSIVHLDGGFADWQKAGLPVEK